MIQSLVYNHKALRKDLDFQQNPIKEGRILTNGMLARKYLNYNKIIIEMTGWYVKKVSHSKQDDK